MAKIMTICGSSRFVDIMAVCSWLLERDEGCLVFGLHLLPMWYPDCPPDHLAEHEGVESHMDDLHRQKIDLSAEVFVVDIEGYIGKSTRGEIEYAESKGKRIRYYSSDPIGRHCERLLG